MRCVCGGGGGGGGGGTGYRLHYNGLQMYSETPLVDDYYKASKIKIIVHLISIVIYSHVI